MVSPQLEGDALAAVRHRGSHLQIIASAGSGKTEVVSQRVADLLAEGVPATAIVAFTFTARAATELRQRIAERSEDRMGRAVLDHLGGLFVGTIHAYCSCLLQTRVPRYETYDVLDDHQLTAFLAREATRLDLKRLDPRGRLFGSIDRFLQGVDVVENELLDPSAMPEPFRAVLLEYLDTLERYRLLTYGQQVVRAVRELEREEVRASVHAELRHLVVDEYQDVNPAQERLVELLAGPGVEVCVVGDDDQAVFQWRGSDVGDIVGFGDPVPERRHLHRGGPPNCVGPRRPRPDASRAGARTRFRSDGDREDRIRQAEGLGDRARATGCRIGSADRLVRPRVAAGCGEPQGRPGCRWPIPFARPTNRAPRARCRVPRE